MNPNESWLAEQARLLTLEDGFGPSSSRGSGASGAASGGDDAEAGNSRASGT
jgi:hypothetical protein